MYRIVDFLKDANFTVFLQFSTGCGLYPAGFWLDFDPIFLEKDSDLKELHLLGKVLSGNG